MFCIKGLHGCPRDHLFDLIREDLDLSFRRKMTVECNLFLLGTELLTELLYHGASVLFLSGSSERVIRHKVIDLLSELPELLLRRDAWIASQRQIRYHIFFLLDYLPEEHIAEVLLKLGIHLGIVRQYLVFIPADKGEFKKQSLGCLGQELLGVCQLLQVVDFIVAQSGLAWVNDNLHEVVRLILRLHDEALSVGSIHHRHLQQGCIECLE